MKTFEKPEQFLLGLFRFVRPPGYGSADGRMPNQFGGAAVSFPLPGLTPVPKFERMPEIASPTLRGTGERTIWDGKVVDASLERPYLSFRLTLDPSVVTSVMVESGVGHLRGDGGGVKALDVSAYARVLRADGLSS